MELLVKKLHPDAKLPIRMSTDAIGYDLFAYIKQAQGKESRAILPPHNTRIISTGICCQFTSLLFYPQIVSRSGLAKRGIIVANAPGIIDPDYTGEVLVILLNSSHETHYISHNDRIAQIVFAPRVTTPMREVVDFLPTIRGSAGFGSTGR